MVVRSHQSKKYGLGFDLMHDEKLIRVFSARDYEGHCNDGAVLLVRPIADDEEQSYERPSCMSVRAQVLGSYAKALGHRGSAVPSSNGTAWQRGSGLGHCKMQVPLASIVGTWHRHVEFVVCRTVTGLYNRDRPCQSYLPQMWGNDVYPYQCRRKWLKRNLRTSCPSMTRTQTVFCFSRRTRECCTDLVPGKRRKPSRNYKNWRLWRRLWIFFGVGEYHCFGFVWHEIGQKSIDGFLLAEMGRLDEIVSCPKMVFVPRFCTSFGGCWTPSSRFCDAFPYSGDPFGGLSMMVLQLSGARREPLRCSIQGGCWVQADLLMQGIRKEELYYKLRHLERSAQNCNNDSVRTRNICNVLKLQCSEESVPRKRKEQWVRFFPHLKRMTRKDMFGSVYKKPLGVS